MARAPTTADAFNAIAEPRRREILGLLAESDVHGTRQGGVGLAGGAWHDGGGAERDVTWLVEKLGWPQPQVSKHLSVLRKVGLVTVVRKGKRRMYTMNGINLRPVFDWVKSFERYWEHQLLRIKDRAEKMQRESKSKNPPQQPS